MLSQKAKYALRALLMLAEAPAGELVLIQDIADRQNVPKKFLELILVELKRHGFAHSQQLDGGLDVMLGVRSPEQVGGMGGLWHPLGISFNQMQSGDVLADCGRIGASSPQLPVVQSARLVVLVCTATGSSVAHLRERLSSLVHHVDAQLGVVVVADPKRRDGVKQVWTVLDAMSVPVRHRWHLAYDPVGAAFFDGRGHGRLDKTQLIRSATDITAEMAALAAAPPQHEFDMAQAAFPPGEWDR